jgi:autoinducer 2-degrading protein
MSRLAIIVEFEVKDGQRAAFAEVIRDHATGSLAEDRCERFDVLLPRDDESRAFCFEIWRDDAALQKHLDAPRMEIFRTRRVPLIDGSRAAFCDFG